MTTVSRDTSPVRPVPRPTPPAKPRKPAAEVHGSCRWLELPIALRDFESGVLAITSMSARGKPLCEEYVVTLPADRSGARLTKPDGTQYHVDLATGHCDCPDHEYRGRQCKHHKAIVAAVSVLPAKPKHAACPRCCERVPAPGLCVRCEEEEAEFAAYHQAEEMEAGGLDPWAECGDDRYTLADEPPQLEEADYFDPADLS